jgi:CheY-like chemotaxis protein
MSHELRTPLNSVIALSGVLNRRLSGKIPEDEYNYLGIIEKNGKNLLSLINDILDLSRIEAGREEISYSEFSMCDLVNDIVNSIDPIIKEKGLEVICHAPPDLPLIISDSTKCHHIIQNIVSNAIKFTEKGTVEISGFVQNDNLHISVKDSGIGIPEEFLPYIFDEFRQADDKASRKFGGTGLGLAIVKKYCQLLNGSIEVSSTQGAGSSFTVILPVKPSAIHLSENKTESDSYKVKDYLSSDSAGETGSGKTLLLVEDSEPQIIQLTDILRNEGYIIQVARNGREALDSIKTTIPDAMILDLQMPDVDGFEVLREIRNLRETKSIPVLILTAKHITKSELSFLKENNIFQLIQKGAVNRNDLLACINNLMITKLKSNPPPVKPKKPQKNKDERATILVIEDNSDNLITLKALLEEKHIISSAADGSEGLEKALTVNPNLILLDISLPGMDGFKVLDEIRNNEKLKNIPVVALTARAMKGDRENLLAYGFDGYIAKPIDGETFEKTINEFF